MRTVRRRRLALIIGALVATLLLARWTGVGQVDENRSTAESIETIETLTSKRRVASLRGETPPAEQAAGAPGLASGSEPHGDPPVVPAESPPPDEDKLAEDAIEPIFLEPLALAEGGPTFTLAGFDPYAPRELVAWRILHGRAVIMSRGSSGPGGVIRFPEIPAPRDGFEVVVSEAGRRPELQGASLRRTLDARAPEAPHAQVSGIGGEYDLHIVPRETTGAVLIADFAGNVFARYEVPDDPAPSNRVIDIALTLPETDTEIWMAHQLGGGRVSQWRVVRFAQPDIDPGGG